MRIADTINKLFINKEGKMATSIIVGIILVVGLIGFGSTYFLGKDNPVEQEAETIVEEEVEQVLDLPAGSEKGKINLNAPGAKDKTQPVQK